jgi:exonuclease III
MELNFLTWNIKGDKKTKIFFHDLNAQITESKIDILILQECFFDEHINELIDFVEIDSFLSGRGIKKWVRIFLNKNSKIDYDFSTPYINNKLRCVELKADDGFTFNLIGVHLYSKAGISDSEQMNKNKDIPRLIEEYELGKTDKTIIVGDLNHRPFDLNLTHPDFLKTTNDKSIVDIFGSPEVSSKRFFYNPMWNLLGDYDSITGTQKPAGTYYWYTDDVEKCHWNLIDGVLLSPTVMNNVSIKSIRIISEMNGKSLIKPIIPKTKASLKESLLAGGFSDHLPVSFTFKTI